MRITLPRSLPAAQLDVVDDLLRAGREVPGSRAPLADLGTNGAMDTMLLQCLGGGPTVHALQVPPYAQAAQEDFTWQLVRRLGIEYMFSPSVLRADGTAMLAVEGGRTALKAGLRDADDLHRSLVGLYERELPQLGRAGALEQARVDLELAQVVDHIVANSDRHGGNILHDAATGAVHFVDIGNMGTPGPDRLKPMLHLTFLTGGGARSIELHPRTIEVLRNNLTPDDLAELHARLRDSLAAYPGGKGASLSNRGRQHLLGRILARGSFLDDMVARRNAIVETGRLDYRPAELRKIIATTWLRAYGREAAGVAGLGTAATGAWLVARD